MKHEHDGVPVDHTGMTDEELDRCRREAELEQFQRRANQRGLEEIGIAIAKHLSNTGVGYCSLPTREIGRLAIEAIPLDQEEEEGEAEEGENSEEGEPPEAG